MSLLSFFPTGCIMTTSSSGSFLDRPAARLLALGVAAASVGLAFYINRADFIPVAEEASPQDTAYQACVSERHAGIDDMIRDGVITDAQAGLFKSRADALCRSTNPPQ